MGERERERERKRERERETVNVLHVIPCGDLPIDFQCKRLPLIVILQDKYQY